jgi:hypothetical protein
VVYTTTFWKQFVNSVSEPNIHLFGLLLCPILVVWRNFVGCFVGQWHTLVQNSKYFCYSCFAFHVYWFVPKIFFLNKWKKNIIFLILALALVKKCKHYKKEHGLLIQHFFYLQYKLYYINLCRKQKHLFFILFENI